MTNKKESRRDFIKASILGGGCIGLGMTHLLATDQKNPCKEQIDALRFKMRQHHARDKVRLIQKLKEQFGDKLIQAVKRNTIEETEKAYRTNRKIVKRDLAGVKHELWNSIGEGFEFKIVRDTPDYLEFKVTKCYLAEISRELKSADIGDALSCAWDIGFCSGLNPKIQFRRSKTLMQGDDCCNHSYRLEKTQM